MFAMTVRSRWVPLAFVLALSGCAMSGETTGSAPVQPMIASDQLHPGLRHHIITRLGETPMRTHVVTVDLGRPGLRFGVTPGDDSQGMEHVAKLSSEYLDEIDALLVINASYFLPFRGGSRGGDDYYPHVGQPVSVSGAAVSGRRQVSPVETHLDERVDSIVCFAGARVAVFDGQTCAGGYSDGVAAGPRLLNQGRRLAFTGDYSIGRHPRTAIGVSADRRTAWIVVVDGRQDHSVGASLDELTDIFVELGAADAINLDGGGSSILVVEGEHGRPVILNSPIHTGVPGRERPVANHVMLFQDPVR